MFNWEANWNFVSDNEIWVAYKVCMLLERKQIQSSKKSGKEGKEMAANIGFNPHVHSNNKSI